MDSDEYTGTEPLGECPDVPIGTGAPEWDRHVVGYPAEIAELFP